MRDLRFALRLLSRSPAFATVAIVTLALGMGANAAFFSVLNSVVLAELPYPEAARLVSIRHVHADDGAIYPHLSRAEVRDIRERSRAFSQVAAADLGRMTLTGTGHGEGMAQRVKVSRVTPNLFSVLGVNPTRGRVLVENDTQTGTPAAVISAGLWQSHFGGAADVLTRTVRLNGADYAVVGVMPTDFRYPEPEMAAWLPLDLRPRDTSDRDDRYLFTAARLAPGISEAAAARDLQGVANALRHDLPGIYRDATWSLGVASLRESQVGHMRLSLGVLQGAAAFVLLIACVNVAIMSLLRAVGRRRELAVRIAIGAGRSHVVRQLLTESAVLCTLGAVGGLLIARIAIDVIKAFAPAGIPRLDEVSLSVPIAIFMAAVLVVVTVIVALAPVAVATRFRSIDGGVPTGRVSDGRATARLRDGLTVMQVALAVTLVIGAGLTLRSLHKLLTVDVGFTTTHIVSFKTNLTEAAYPDAARVEQFYTALGDRLQAVPGVHSVAGISYLPLSGEGQLVSAAPAGTSDDTNIQIGWGVVRGRYFESMGITLLHGRLFEGRDRATTPSVAIVDAALARRWFASEAAAIGQRMRVRTGPGAQTWTIVGVVRSVSHNGPATASPGMAYAPQAQVYQRGMYTVVQTSTSPEMLMQSARAALASVDPAVPMYFAASMETRYDDAIALPRFRAGLVSAFSMLALVLAGVGIFGVTAYAVTQRTREFGIRLALGAQRGHIRRIVLRKVGVICLLGMGVGVMLGNGLGSLMAGLLFGVTPNDPVTFAVALIVIGLTTLAAIVAPISRAVRVSPALTLKAE